MAKLRGGKANPPAKDHAWGANKALGRKSARYRYKCKDCPYRTDDYWGWKAHNCS